MTSTPPSPSTTSATNHPSSSSSPTTGTATATATATSAGAATAPPSKPPSPPVHILATKPSRVYSFLHPVVLPLLLAARFAPLVADPVAELSGNLPLLAVLQVVFVVVCLPPAGSGYGAGAGAGAGAGSGAAAGTAAGGAGAGRRRQHHGKGDLGLSSKVVPALISLTLTTLLATPAFTILLVLFGAPLTTHNFETILCAAHMAMLSATPLVYVHGVDGSTWREIWGVNRPTDAVWGGALGTGVGAWFGAVPIPLDWDRPWQAYPITILTGAYIGYAVGSLISRSSWLYGRRIQFVPEEDQKAEKVE